MQAGLCADPERMRHLLLDLIWSEFAREWDELVALAEKFGTDAREAAGNDEERHYPAETEAWPSHQVRTRRRWPHCVQSRKKTPHFSVSGAFRESSPMWVKLGQLSLFRRSLDEEQPRASGKNRRTEE